MTMKNESGRSMVEMLGVLAIIGVLSIGGIAGYSMAMNRYRANNIIHAASQVSVIDMTRSGGTETDLDDVGITAVDCVSGMTADEHQGVVEITLDGNCDDIHTILESIGGDRISNCDAENAVCEYNPNPAAAAPEEG